MLVEYHAKGMHPDIYSSVKCCQLFIQYLPSFVHPSLQQRIAYTEYKCTKVQFTHIHTLNDEVQKVTKCQK